jgi:co-chaperonin GroES (HSP10)
VEQEKKIGLIIVPTTVRHKMDVIEGEVVEVGNGTPDIPMELRVGDIVKFKHGENRLIIDELVLLDQDDVLFIVNR